MTVIPFDERPSFQTSPAAQSESPDGRPPQDDQKERAVIELLEHGVLSHAIGQYGEYKVRTTLVTRQAWQYRSYVLRQGKAIKGAFYPIIVERTPPGRRGNPKPWNAEDWRLSLAQEAVEVHFTRCAALREYLVLSAIYDQPRSQSRRWYTLLAPLIGIACAVAYGVWAHTFRIDSGPPPGKPAPVVADRGPTREPASIPIPASSSTASHNSINEQAGVINEQAGVSSPVDRAETPKAVSLNDLLALQGPPQKADPASRALTPGASPGSAASDLQAGDVLRVTGWLLRVSRAPDGAYLLHVSANRDHGARTLTAMLPPPDQALGSPSMQSQLQTARAFIRQQLLRQQEPSPRGSVMQRPISVQLTGQLANPAASPGAPSQGKRSQNAPPRWEIRPVFEVQFTTPSPASNRSRAR
jgi:hypothetical protein